LATQKPGGTGSGANAIGEMRKRDDFDRKGRVRYRPIQSISYEFGSKAMSGYFVRRNSLCVVTLMIAEKTDPDLPPPTATRVRMMLEPGQVAGLDRE
jgi:hypothetical protein